MPGDKHKAVDYLAMPTNNDVINRVHSGNEDNLLPIEYDADLSPELAHLKKLSQELLDPELYVRLVEMLGVAIVVVNPKGEIVIFNGQAELLFGFRRVEVLSHNIEMLVPDQLRSKHEVHRAQFEQEPRARPMGIDLPLMARHKTGRGIAVEINLVPIPTTAGVCTAAVVWRKR